MKFLPAFVTAALFLSASVVAAEQTSNADDSRTLRSTQYNDTVSGRVPTYGNHFANVWAGVQAEEQPLFWYIGRAGGNTFSKIVAKCLNATQISSKGDTTDTLIPYTPPAEIILHQDDNAPYFNINPNTKAGLDFIASEGILSDRSAEILITPRLVDAGALFSGATRARALVMLRHPVKREIDQFYWRASATWDPHFDPQIATSTLLEFASTTKLIDNFVVRSLNDNLPLTEEVTAGHVETAKNVLREKFIVGIFEWYDASIERFEKYLGWWDKFNVGTDATMNTCHSDMIAEGDHIGVNPKVDTGSEIWQKLIVRTWADVELYTYAKHLYAEQAHLLPTTA